MNEQTRLDIATRAARKLFELLAEMKTLVEDPEAYSSNAQIADRQNVELTPLLAILSRDARMRAKRHRQKDGILLEMAVKP